MRPCSSSELRTRASRLAKRGSPSSSGAPIARNTPAANSSVGPHSANHPSSPRNVPYGARRGTQSPVRVGMPIDSNASNGSHATNDVSAPSIDTSTCCPWPPRCTSRRADSVPITANSGAERSPRGKPKRIGASSGLPAVSMRPLSACTIVSIALEPPSSSDPNRVMEVYTSDGLTSRTLSQSMRRRRVTPAE